MRAKLNVFHCAFAFQRSILQHEFPKYVYAYQQHYRQQLLCLGVKTIIYMDKSNVTISSQIATIWELNWQ